MSDNPARKERFEGLLNAYAPALRRLCAAHRRNHGDQQELFQEIAMALWKALPDFRGDSSERTWLYRIATNVSLTDSARRQSKRNREVGIEEAPPAPESRDSRTEELFDAVRRLETVDRDLALLYLEGLTAAEIGAVMGIAEGNAAVRLTRMRRKLTAMLNPSKASL